MIYEDRDGSVIDVRQLKDGSVSLIFCKTTIVFTHEQAKQFPLYDLEEFDVKTYELYYKVKLSKSIYNRCLSSISGVDKKRRTRKL